MKKLRRPQRQKTRYHKILFEQDSPFRAQTIPNKKKRIPRKGKYSKDLEGDSVT